ncbi:MGH1-like glycoside hydrolase domain-containing protein [Candidatus Leptofilum sp.]|uniref:MGH1-like glycoside hydrolase domain-containing protein n=1 Tax=Candidatus Leptofilum sp. TaxID=3241576 RepID=UPI003B5B2DBE
MNRLIDEPQLVKLRASLAAENELMQRGIFTDLDTGRDYFTGYAYETLYDWDQYFEAIIQIYMGWPSDYIKNGVTIFLNHQRNSGLISRSVPSNEMHDPEHVKPFLAQIGLLVAQNYGETDWILNEHYFPRLQRYLDYWLEEMDENGNGLSEWMSAPHSGMDNQHERAGYWGDRFCEGVDLNAYLVRELRAFAALAVAYGKRHLADTYRQTADELAERIRTLLWDEEDGFFYDGNGRFHNPPRSQHAGWASTLNAIPNDPLIRVKSVSAFAALWAEVATPAQTRRMIVEHLFNPREFWSPYPIAALARSERWYSQDRLPNDLGCNWRAKTWIPTNYIAYHGLRAYGYRELATLVAHYTHKLVLQAGNREYYDAEDGRGQGLNPFWGWSLLAHFLPYEESRENDMTSLGEVGE